jgi:PAS domain S-box-containing protein
MPALSVAEKFKPDSIDSLSNLQRPLGNFAHMKIKELNHLNRTADFRRTLFRYQEEILIGLTIGGSLVVGLWLLFDRFYSFSDHSPLVWLRLLTIGVYMLNLMIAMIRKSERGYKQHLIAGFYFGAVYCMLLTMFTGATQSPYWYSLLFILVAWFVVMNLPYRELIMHGMMFIVMFLAGQYAQKEFPVGTPELLQMVFLYLGVFLIGTFSAISRNLADARKYLADKELSRINADLEKFRLALDQAPVSVFIMDKEWNFEFINPSFEKMSGYQAIDLLHHNIRDTLYKGLTGTPESRKAVVEAITSGESWEGELHTINREGTGYWAQTIASPYKDNLDEIIGYIVIQKDITEQHALKNALEKSEQKYKTLIEKATDGIVITQDGLLKFANKAMLDMMQHEPDEMLEKSFYQFVVPEEHALMREYHKRRMAGEDFHTLYRSRFYRKDGQIITVELNSRTSDYQGRPAAFIVIRDITKRLVIEEELKRAKEELEELNRNLEERVKESSDNLTEARTQLIRLQKENLQSQFEVLRQQVNPHFLFNSLNVLTSLIKLEPDLAEQFTEYLSKVYRYVLENKDHDLVELRTELHFLDAYLFLLNIRFMDKITVVIDVAEEQKSLLILPLALQLLIENAIKHNAMSKKKPLRIGINVDEHNFLHISNNLQERESYIASTGVGLKNIRHRYELLEMPSPEFLKTETTFTAKIPLKEAAV